MSQNFSFRMEAEGAEETAQKLEKLRRQLESLGPGAQKGAEGAATAMEKFSGSVDRTRQRMEAYNQASSRTAGVNDNAARSYGKFGQTVQQAGFQMQDFAVQVASGQSALVAFAQQAPQFLGLFGPAGAIAGAVVAIGAVAAQFFLMRDASKDAAKAVTELTRANERLDNLLLSSEELRKRAVENKRAEAAAAVEAAIAVEVEAAARARAELESLRKTAEANDKILRNSRGTLTLDPTVSAQSRRAMAFFQNQIEAADKRVAELTARFEQLWNPPKKSVLADELAGLNSLVEKGKALTESLMDPWERFAAKQKEFNELLAAGAISAETFRRAIVDANPGKLIESVSAELITGFAKEALAQAAREAAAVIDANIKAAKDRMKGAVRMFEADSKELERLVARSDAAAASADHFPDIPAAAHAETLVMEALV